MKTPLEPDGLATLTALWESIYLKISYFYRGRRQVVGRAVCDLQCVSRHFRRVLYALCLRLPTSRARRRQCRPHASGDEA